MVRLRSKSSRPYSGRSVLRALRQRRARRSERIVVSAQKSAEAIVPGATSRENPGRTHNPGRAELGRQYDHSWTQAGVDAEWRSRSRASLAEKECCSILRDCQEPPDADPHVRWCGGREVNPPGYPIRPRNRHLESVLSSVALCLADSKYE